MADAPRISVQDAREQMRSGQALLVCAYEDEAKCNRMRLEGAVNLGEFQRRQPTLAKNQPVIFYCA